MSGPAIPKLPGYTVCLPQSLSDKGFRKGQTLNYVNGYQREDAVSVVKDLPEHIKQATDAAIASGGTATLSASMVAPDMATKLPQWVENDRKVLRFFGYFKESVVESNMENHRIRKVILYYYLEDDSMHVAEPRQDNSGIPQGVFIKRHRCTRDDGGFFSPAEFAVGETVTIYGRTFFLVDADPFTREYMSARGKEMGPPMGYPDDPVDAYRTTFGMNRGRAPTGDTAAMAGTTTGRLNDFKAYVEARLGKPSHLLEGDKLRQFLENNKKVLRFWCVWDERLTMYGDRRPYVLHYFLEDDSVEILEVNENNSGRDPFPIFLKRGPLPKVPQKANTTLNPKYPKHRCYGPGDFRLGTYITVHGRDFYLHDADTFTKNWYRDNLGYGDEDLTAIDIKEPIHPKPKAAVPAYNGYGTIEDSLQNCLSLVPKPPKRDLHKLMNKDKIILRFVAKIVDTDTHKHSPTDLARRFILSYFLMDDSILIFEPPVRNTGIAGGKFLERQKIYKPRSEEIYTYLDLYVGGTIDVFNRTFELLEGDEYTYMYMENYKDIFVMADTDVLIRSLKAQVSGKEDAIRTALIAQDKSGSGALDGDALEVALRSAGLKFTRHQAISLKRRLDGNNTGTISIEEFLGLLGLRS